MKQGNLFDDLYDDQQVDTGHELPSHQDTEELYTKAVEGVIKQRLVTYYKDSMGMIKRVEKTRTFKPSYSTITSIEVFE